MVKWSVQQEDTKFVNIYVPDIGAPKYTEQILTELKREIDSHTIIVRDFPHLHNGQVIQTKSIRKHWL